MIAEDRVTIVAGNGGSLARISPGRVLADDFFIRVNNFFFETAFHLGRRVDLAFIAGDPRLAPFVFATLRQALAQYDLRSWSSHHSTVIRAGKRRLPRPFLPMRYADTAVAEMVTRLSADYGAIPTTGLLAALLAQALGARRIVLAGIDLYEGETRYAYVPGRHQRDLMGADLMRRGYDRRLHHPDLDRRLIDWLARRQELDLSCASPASPLAAHLPLAPQRWGPAPAVEPKERIQDWASWDGMTPIAALKLARHLRAWQRWLTGRPRAPGPQPQPVPKIVAAPCKDTTDPSSGPTS